MAAKGIAFLFPGQGSQTVGMGADIYEQSPAARQVFERADQALGMALSTLCFQGPEEQLRETINAQPAIVTVSLALLAALQERLASHFSWSSPLTPTFTAGHSVGEYAALVAAGALDLEDAVRLVRERGRLMHHEGSVCPGGMAAVIGLDEATLQEICQEASQEATREGAAAQSHPDHPGWGKVSVANLNAPGQIVISGEQRALALAMERAKARGAKRVIPLAVSGAFHSPVMEPAAAGLAQALATTPLRHAAIPIISNIEARPLTEAEALRQELARQIVAPVQWVRSVEYLATAGVSVYLEIGPGSVLTGLVKRIARDATTLTISNANELDKAVTALREQGLLQL
ncbi:ACP S-malonyltransferase [Thermogemmatispora tikiterensis]|uniref:Malonyl CoA-acyl carrier protein transacylase n=1 Tax=Thermogemmatispora tikiterensis TaxID=1825093 RepID=A0A328VN74_9CHLR|nr:ACP S-malonyltransferase [Thermogemmatispora tikiterensis]RAQ97093.1 [acyl-carrier-protein] S-malonyltransferase [Thermogemmatispora tikiterensis]